MKRICLALLILGLTGCHEAGKWEDHPKNFERIFHDSPPDKLVIVHSWFWRSRYFATEFAYFLQVKPNEDFRNGLWQNNHLKPAVTEKDREGLLDFSPPKPAWFIPKPIDQYEAWIYSDKPHRHFRVFIDKETRELFLCDYQ